MRKKSVERRGDLCFTADCLDEVVDQHGYDLLAARAAYKKVRCRMNTKQVIIVDGRKVKRSYGGIRVDFIACPTPPRAQYETAPGATSLMPSRALLRRVFGEWLRRSLSLPGFWSKTADLYTDAKQMGNPSPGQNAVAAPPSPSRRPPRCPINYIHPRFPTFPGEP